MGRLRALALGALVLAAGGLIAPAAAQAPLSAIDWLREAPVQPATAAQTLPVSPPAPAVPPEAAISVRPLSAVRADSVGLYPSARVGLAPGIWGPSTTTELAGLIGILPTDTLPALRDLTYRLLLAEFDPPAPTAEAPDVFVVARIDALVRMGALDQAGAILDTLESLSPDLVARRFDIRLLLGDDEAACAQLAQAVQGAGAEAAAQGSLPAAAVFCQARGGDWAGAERALDQARAGSTGLTPDYLPLLERFVDFDGHVGEDPGPLPAPSSPLTWRLLEALGDPVATQGLPLAYAHADLRGTAGWRAQIEAAERLVRSGALPPNRLIGLYTERRAAASGGIWERVRRVQALDDALAAADSPAIGRSLVAAWQQIQDGELEVAFADLFARRLMAVDLQGPAAEVAMTLGLLSEDYELAALALDPDAAPIRLRRLASVARGLVPDPGPGGGSDSELAVLAAFGDAVPLPEASAARLAEGRVGEELLRILIRAGASGDPRMLAEAIAILRHLGLEDIARRTALQALLLERRG